MYYVELILSANSLAIYFFDQINRVRMGSAFLTFGIHTLVVGTLHTPTRQHIIAKYIVLYFNRGFVDNNTLCIMYLCNK